MPSFSDMILLRKAGVDQRLRADDAAGAAAAIDDDRGVGRRRQIGKAIDQLGARHADRGRDAVVVVLLVGAAVEDRDVGAAVDQLLQLGRGDPRRAGLVLDHLGERLAGHMDAAIEAIAGGLPGGDAALQHRDIRDSRARSCARRPGSPGPSPSSHQTTRAARRGTRSSTSNSSRLSGTHDAISRCRRLNGPSSRASRRAISPPSCSCAFNCRASMRLIASVNWLPSSTAQPRAEAHRVLAEQLAPRTLAQPRPLDGLLDRLRPRGIAMRPIAGE